MLKKYSLLLIILLSSCADNTNNSEQKSEEVSAPDQNDDLKYLAQDFREKIYMPHENIKVAVGYGLANSILVLGNSQSLVVDTMGGIETASRVIADLNIPLDKPVTTLAYTHFHADHTLGAQAFVDQFPIENVISHETTVAEIRDFFGIKRDLISERSLKMFGSILQEKDKTSSSGIGIKLETGIDTPGYIKPSITFSNFYSHDLDGLEIQFFHAPGETDDQLFVWIPEYKTLMPGDNIYKAFPNIYTIRGTTYRSFKSWYTSLEKMMALEPQILIPSHGTPINGKEEISRVLSNYRDAIKFVHDQMMRNLNSGSSPLEAARKIKLPENLARDPHLFELYGTIEWSARNLFNGYFGWFDGNPTNLYPFTKEEYSEKLLTLIPEEQLISELDKALAEEDSQWALYISDLLIDSGKVSDQILAKKAAALKNLGDSAYNPNAVSFYRSTYAELTNSTSDKVFITGDSQIEPNLLDQLDVLMFLETMAIRLDPGKVAGIADTKFVKFTDLDEVWKLRLENSVFTYEKVSEIVEYDIEMSSLTFKSLVTGTINPITGILLTNNNAKGPNKRGFLELLSNFQE
ncbi:MAG: MBL fold metallo-hydrolase [Proteobacteria bacterium]|nr:MBL fold metallo-hydrolase [SAR86 cluster bacterium]MDA0345316.1 MBL fold metallo-hydrolase [Pseudomonadota bacterium]MDA0900243.1 MBL fold metallo-hydrolase [Pseudomonadota bacterium]